MTISSSMNTTNKKSRIEHNGSSTSITSLPRHLLVDVVARVASHSVVDLRNIKQCCKAFLHASEDNYVWQQVCLDNFPLTQNWVPNEKAVCFLRRCRESGNVESLYREGLLEFFKFPKGNINGLDKLKLAAAKGHMEGKYVYGMILLCSHDDELRKEGLEYMRFVRKSKCIIKCKSKVKQLLDELWKGNGMVVRNPTPTCRSKNTCKGWRVKKGVWSFLDDEDDDLNLCEYCRWDYELDFFYKILHPLTR